MVATGLPGTKWMREKAKNDSSTSWIRLTPTRRATYPVTGPPLGERGLGGYEAVTRRVGDYGAIHVYCRESAPSGSRYVPHTFDWCAFKKGKSITLMKGVWAISAA